MAEVVLHMANHPRQTMGVYYIIQIICSSLITTNVFMKLNDKVGLQLCRVLWFGHTENGTVCHVPSVRRVYFCAAHGKVCVCRVPAFCRAFF